MESLNWLKNSKLLMKDRFKHITCVIVQIYKLEGNSWRELTKDFVLLHMYYDQEDKEAKLIAIDGIKLIVRGFVLSSSLQLVRPTKKFVHFISSKHGRSEMYGFGFQQVCEVEQFLRLFSIVHRRLHLSSKTVIQSGFECNKRRLSISSTKSQPPSLLFLSTKSTQEQLSAPKKDLHAIPFFTPNDSPWRELISQADVDVDMQRIEEKLQGLSFASNAAVTAPNFTSTPSLSRQTSVYARSSLHCSNSATFDSNQDATRSVEQKQYQLWSAPPWNPLLEQGAYNNQTSITSAWDSLLNR